jgi:hypothetical protein
VTEVVDDGKGALFSKVVKVIPNVNQTLGYDPAVFAKIGCRADRSGMQEVLTYFAPATRRHQPRGCSATFSPCILSRMLNAVEKPRHPGGKA